MPRRLSDRFVPPTLWSAEQLDADRNTSIQLFRDERLAEPVQQYLQAFRDSRAAVGDLFTKTQDLGDLDSLENEDLATRTTIDALRYLAAPPISIDDLKTLVNTSSLSKAAFSRDPDLKARVLSTVQIALDPTRFPWSRPVRAPSQQEREAALLATAALMATQRVATVRRNEEKATQEAAASAALAAMGLVPVNEVPEAVRALTDAPQPGHYFPRETVFGTRKADLLVRLWDGRAMPIECKVSNSSLNSVKRLNNDAAAKAEAWIRDFGATQVVPVAILSGVYNLQNLEEAQQRGLTLYWAHRLEDLTSWIDSTRP